MYSVDLTSAMPPIGRGPLPLFGFLFRIEDVLSENVTYIWQVMEIVLWEREEVGGRWGGREQAHTQGGFDRAPLLIGI